MAEPAAGYRSREQAVPVTIMIVGKSGAGKSTLGNQLLNAGRGPDDDYVKYFKAHGGCTAGPREVTSHTSADGRVRVIDTPGIPDPEKRDTARNFDTIVEKIRAVNAVNLLVFMVKEDRTDEKQFSDYRVLLKQFNYVPWNKLMVCRQPDYTHMPNLQDKQKKQQEGENFVSDILEKSGMAMPFLLHLDGTSEAAGASLDKIVDIAHNSARIPLGDGPSLQTVEERRTFMRRLLSSKERASALREEITRHDTTIKWLGSAAGGAGAIGAAGSYFSERAPMLALISGTLAAGILKISQMQQKKIKAQKKKAEKELRSEEVDEDLLREAKEELDDLNRLCEG